MTQPDHDPLLEAIVALNNAERQIQTAKREVAEAMRDRARVPLSHDYAPLPHVAPFCAFDEPPSRPA